MQSSRLFIVLVGLVLLQQPATADDSPHKHHGSPKKGAIAGKADVLKRLPKKFAALVNVDAANRQVLLHVDGEGTAKTWQINDDAEIKIHGWWGRLDQLNAGRRVWVWFDIDRQERPVSVLMIADELSERDIHGEANASELDPLRTKQREHLKEVWRKEGLPGAVTVLHKIGGEMDVLLDHEAMRWARYLKYGDDVTLQTEQPIIASVKEVRPWRERTSVRLVTDSGLDQADLLVGQRIGLVVPEPPQKVQESDFPADIARISSEDKGGRIEWFLASVYCTCNIKGDKCTGMFYSLASCNRNGCPNPNKTRTLLGKLMAEGKSDHEIFDHLHETRGPNLVKPHLLK
jgi:hypothetical protein